MVQDLWSEGVLSVCFLRAYSRELRPYVFACSFQMALGEEAGNRTWAVLIFIFTSFIFPRK